MTLVTGNFVDGFRYSHLPEDGATAEIFEKAINGKNGKKKSCHVVYALVMRILALPEKKQECIQFLITAAKECGTKNVICTLTNLGVKHPDTRELCCELATEVAFASS